MIIAGVLLPCVPAVINVAFGYGIVTFSPVRCEVAVQDVGFYTEALAEGFEVATLGTLQALVILKLMKVGITTTTVYRPIGRGGSRGFTQTPLLTSKRFYIHRSTVHFKCPTI